MVSAKEIVADRISVLEKRTEKAWDLYCKKAEEMKIFREELKELRDDWGENFNDLIQAEDGLKQLEKEEGKA